MLAVTIAVARGIMRRKSVVGDTMEVFTVVVQVELVKERNVCTRKVPFAVTEVVPIVPRENIGSLPLSLSLFLSLCGPSIDSIFGRETLVSVEIEWPTNCREKEKKKEKEEEKEKPTSAIIAHLEHLVDLRIHAITFSLFLV